MSGGGGPGIEPEAGSGTGDQAGPGAGTGDRARAGDWGGEGAEPGTGAGTGAGNGAAPRSPGDLPAAPFSSACPTQRSATWLWRYSTAPCSRSCRGFWRSSISPRRACTTSDCGCRTNTEVPERGKGGGGDGTFPGRLWSQEPRVGSQVFRALVGPFSLLLRNFLLEFPRSPQPPRQDDLADCRSVDSSVVLVR